ncbi:MAG TPA: aldose epimerase family protein [Solirubrobacteraceae bacterium]|nr:aldose epimerase family protein [Solirubrobacteraceae bacterium]
MLFAHSRRGGRLTLLLAGVLALGAMMSVGLGSAGARGRHAPHAGSHRGAAAAPSISSEPWGTVDGQQVNLYTLKNGHGMTVKITNFGATVQSIWVPNRHGGTTNVALGFPTLADYVADFMQQHTGVGWPLSGGSGDTFFGATIGRYANRIANHSFTMQCTGCSNNGVTYTLPANNGTNTLHGGDLGWNTKVWSAKEAKGRGYVSLSLTLTSPDGDEGFPASLTTTVIYTLTEGGALRIEYRSHNNEPAGGKATVLNLTNHTYFNLAGEGSGPVYDQLLKIRAEKYTPIDTNFIPTAPYFLSVTGTPFDFTHMKPIGRDITNLNLPDGTAGTPYGTNGVFKQLVIAHGYDHNWVLAGSGYRLVAVAHDRGTGITLLTYTDQPGLQFYSGNFLVGDLSGVSGHTYRQTSGFTLETQHYPDSPHHIGQPGWPSVVLLGGQTFTSRTTFAFTSGPGAGTSSR